MARPVGPIYLGPLYSCVRALLCKYNKDQVPIRETCATTHIHQNNFYLIKLKTGLVSSWSESWSNFWEQQEKSVQNTIKTSLLRRLRRPTLMQLQQWAKSTHLANTFLLLNQWGDFDVAWDLECRWPVQHSLYYVLKCRIYIFSPNKWMNHLK